MRIAEWIKSLLFPPKCVLCKNILENGEIDLCKPCRCDNPVYKRKSSRPQFLDSFTAVWYYEEKVRSGLLRYKFGRYRSYAQSYGRLLAMVLLEEYPEGFDYLTWIPVSRRRRLQRGFDQVELIAYAVGRELQVKPVPLLKKIRHNRPQSGLRDSAHRRANVLGAYKVLTPEMVSGKRIVLLDDILTTGATASECARVLKTAGAKEVHCAAMAAVRK